MCVNVRYQHKRAEPIPIVKMGDKNSLFRQVIHGTALIPIIFRGRNAGKAFEIMVKVRLVVVAAGQCYIHPILNLPVLHEREGVLEPAYFGVLLGRNAHQLLEKARKVSPAIADFIPDLGNARRTVFIIELLNGIDNRRIGLKRAVKAPGEKSIQQLTLFFC